MSCNVIFIVLLILIIVLLRYETFQLNHYIRPNFESGANMLRGDLPIKPIHHHWFNTRYGPTSLVPGFF